MRSLCILFLFFLNGIFSQELPPIQNYTPVDYGAENQNWAISQSPQKYVYIANNAGLLEFNGAKWKLYHNPYGTRLTSVSVVDDRIYTGSYMEFGYWKKDDFGNLNYYSLSKKLQEPFIEDEQFWNILKFQDWILFQSLDRIYIYNTLNESVEIIAAKTTKAHIFRVGDGIYFQKINEGFFKIENGRAVLVSDHAVVKTDIVVGAFEIEERILLVTERNGFYFVSGNDLKKWNITADIELSAIGVHSSLQLTDNSFILGTISNGIFHLDAQGNLIRGITQAQGLNNNTILSIFEDAEHNLWLGLDNGISVVNLSSPFNEYNDGIGKLGVVYSAKMFNGYLYLGTNQGLFYRKEGIETDFKRIDKVKGQVWLLKEIYGTLFCGHNSGTFVVDQDTAEQISEFPGTWDIKTIEGNKNLLLQGNFKGLSILERKNDRWQFRNKIEGFANSSRFFEFVDKHRILVNHEYKGIFDLKLDSLYYKAEEVQNQPAWGVGSSLITYNKDILYTTNNGVFKYDLNQHKFKNDSLLTSRFFPEGDPIIGILIPDHKANRLWGFTDKNVVYVAPGKLNDQPQATRIPTPTFFRRNLGVSGFEFITPLKDQLYLIGISNGYITLDLDKLKAKEYEVSLNSVSKVYHDTSIEKASLSETNEFKYSENNLNLTFSVPEFDKYTDVNYQYQLKGLYDQWGTWSPIPEVSFKNLRYGDYTFRVRAKAGNTLSKNIASYSFVISRPWYLSNLALLAYALALILISVLVHKLYKAYYRKQQQLLLKENEKKLKRKKLKAQKKIIQIKNEKLKHEIDSKNRELAISTMSIIKKNEFLNAIKDQLKEHSDQPGVKSVIRTINRNINNSDDWKFFEDAFNNADKDFLQKVKTQHPELTSNDLKLCAYLRLNLSSKEIAPLLNISVRSVEVKRYRLRKKMQLPRESGLTEYILQL